VVRRMLFGPGWLFGTSLGGKRARTQKVGRVTEGGTSLLSLSKTREGGKGDGEKRCGKKGRVGIGE